MELRKNDIELGKRATGPARPHFGRHARGKMKKVLIISPNFPPVNGADMHRIRQSLPYFRELGWEPVVLAVDEKYVGAYSTDQLLLHTVPGDLEIHKLAAWETSR